MTGFGESRKRSVAATSAASSVAPGDRPADLGPGLLGQVVAGAEGAPGTLEDDDPHVRVGLGRVERVDQRVDERAVERVELAAAGRA